MSTTSNASEYKVKQAVFRTALAQKTIKEYMAVIRNGYPKTFLSKYDSIKACGEDWFREGRGGAASGGQMGGEAGNANNVTRKADEVEVFRTALAQETMEDYMAIIRNGCPKAYVTSYQDIKTCGEDRYRERL